MTIPPGPEGPDRQDSHDDDIDAEFARMMQGMDLDVPDLDGPSAAEGEPDPRAAQPDAPRPIAVVATSVASAKALAGAIRLGREARSDGIDVPEGTRVHPTRTGAIAAGAFDESAAHDLAAVVSTALQRNGVVLFWRRGDRMTATRYRQGHRGEEVSPALVLGAVDSTVEQLLLGALSIADIERESGHEGLDPRELSRTQALRWITTGRRRP